MRLTRRTALAGAAAAAAGGGSRVWAQARGGLGERLYGIVEGYSKWPHHRSATPEGRNTVSFIDSELKKLGAPTKRIPYEFDRYEFFAEVRAKGRLLESLPLFYEAFNQVSSTTPIIRPVTLENNVDRKEIAGSITSPPNAKSPIVLLPTFSKFGAEPPKGTLIGVDADPARKGSGIPTLMISGEHLETLKAGGVAVEFRAKRLTDRDETITAELGAGGLQPLVITTPIGGWFTAAGERGTGIAIALELAAFFAREMPVIFIATTGNELEFNGLKSFIKWGYKVEPYGVVHIGAAVGAGTKKPGERTMSLASTRVAMSSKPAGPNTGMGAALKPGNFAGTERFTNEGAIWREFLGKDVPLLSFDGTFPLMRTPDDLPDLATTPALMETAYKSVLDATRALLAA
ncbi:MAG: hypothetical protein JO055_03645 [Alphaproteobacteria bacterium]|nr:hypothetical protein [Alphaproteobacteria bacterium]